MNYFYYKHLPAHLKDVSRRIHDIAHFMDGDLPDCREKTKGLDKLLEAKDCFVRAKLVKVTNERHDELLEHLKNSSLAGMMDEKKWR